MNIKNNLRSRTTISAIKNAYLNLISTNTGSKITVRQVCQKAGINRATFYAHFLDIYDLSDTIQDQMLSQMKKIFKSNPTESDDLLQSFTKLFSFVKENKTFYYYYFVISRTTAILDITNQEPFRTYINNTAQLEGSTEEWQQKYKVIFFNSGVGAILKVWLKNNCLQSVDQMAMMVVAYIKRFN